MTADDARPTISALLEERGRYEQWLRDLAAKAPNAPTHVVQRVRADYQARLDGVLAQLGGRVEELDRQLAEAAERLIAAEQREQVLRDARAEAELRYMVGEFTDDAWATQSAESDTAIAAATSEREGAALERDDLARNLDAAKQRHPAVEEALAPRTSGPAVYPVFADNEPAARPSIALAMLAAEPEEMDVPPAALQPVAEDAIIPEALAPLVVPEPEAPSEAAAEALQLPIGSADDVSDAFATLPLLDFQQMTPEPPPTVVAPGTANASRPSKAVEIKGVEAFDDLQFLKTIAGGRPSGPVPSVPPPPAPRASRPVALPPMPPEMPEWNPVVLPSAEAQSPVVEAAVESVAEPVVEVPVPMAPLMPAPVVEPVAPVAAVEPPAPAAPVEETVFPRTDRDSSIGSLRHSTPLEAVLGTDADAASLLQTKRDTMPGVDSVRAMSPTPATMFKGKGTGEAAKTLKCGECGAVNYPTEWYCERCGAELASL